MAKLKRDKKFTDFSLLKLDSDGRLINELDKSDIPQSLPAESISFHDYFERRVSLPDGCTDVFLWVHGWRNEAENVIEDAQKLFPGILNRYEIASQRYELLGRFVPCFIAIHWPSMSTIWPSEYDRIRRLAHDITDKGEAEYILAKLLGYLESKKTSKGNDGKTLASKSGFFVHCLGHSFGGRVLVKAILAAANPTPKVLGDHLLPKYTVDSLLVFQMAAPASGYAPELERLVDGSAAFSGSLVLTHSVHDTANCIWHVAMEKEEAIGCHGAKEPRDRIHEIELLPIDRDYNESEFENRIVNVDASNVFYRKTLGAGAHGDYWHEESVHLILSLANLVRKNSKK